MHQIIHTALYETVQNVRTTRRDLLRYSITSHMHRVTAEAVDQVRAVYDSTRVNIVREYCTATLIRTAD